MGILRAVEAKLESVTSKLQPGEKALLTCATGFGVSEVLRVALDNNNLLHIWARNGEQEHFIFAPLALCSFQIIILPETGPPSPARVVFGFGNE